MTEIRLEDVNAAITEHGYKPVSGEQLADLKAVAGADLFGWILDCARNGREAASWESLRNALYGASEHCQASLVALGVRIGRREAVRTLVANGRPLRMAIARAAGNIERGRSVSSEDSELLNRAIGAPSRGAVADVKAARKPDPAQLHHVYGRAFAITFECTTTSAGRHALQVEAAARSQRGQGFDWTQKIALQLVDHEVVELVAVLRGVRNEASFEYHGANRDKSMTVREQRGEQPTFYFNLRRGKESRTVPVPVFNAFRIEALATRVLMASEPGLTATDVAQRIDRLARRYDGPSTPAQAA